MEYLFTETPLAFLVSDLWRDEAFSYVMSSQDLRTLLVQTARDFNPPLYYITLKIWMALFGTSEVALRSLSLVFFAGVIYMFYLFFRNILKLGVAASFLYLFIPVLNPALLFYASEARMYMLSIFLSMLSVYFCLRNRNNLFMLFCALAIYTHYFTFFVLASLFLGKILINYAFKPKKSFENRFKGINIWHFTLPLVAFFPWFIFVVSVKDFTTGSFWVIPPRLEDFTMIPFLVVTGYERVFAEYYHNGAGYISYHKNLNILILFLVAFPVLKYVIEKKLKKIKPNSNNVLYFLLWGFLPACLIYIISVISTPVFHARYFVYAVPGLLLLIVTGLNSLSGFMYNTFTRFFTVNAKFLIVINAIFIASFLITFSEYNKLNIQYRNKASVSGTYKEILSNMQKGDVIFVESELDYYLAMYYAKNNKIYIYGKNYDDIPSYVGKVFMPEEIFTSELPKYKNKAFIVNGNSYTIKFRM